MTIIDTVTRRDVLRYGAGSAAAALLPAAILAQKSPEALAKTTAGPIRGRIEQGIYVYRGVPYGMDTAKTRFAPPKAPEPWTEVKDCFVWGPRTIQPYTAPRPASSEPPVHRTPQPTRVTNYHMPPDQGRESEDCLNLNVWTPAMRDGKKRPVLVYFHGGGYTYGTVNSILYDGNRLAQRGDVVVVTVNARLNAFGFLYLAELGGPGFEDSGMVGQLDLVFALQWIHDNIAEFGGDSSRVTVFGQSGGGGKCSTLMAMPPAKGLFHGVICMSGELLAGIPREAATEHAAAVIKALGLERGDIDAIRTMPLEQVKQAAIVSSRYGPVADGRSLPTGPFLPTAAALSLNVPLILGSTHDETRFLGGVPGVDLFALTWDQVVPTLQKGGPGLASYDIADMVAKYREWNPSYSPTDVYFQITTDTRVWRSEQLAAEKRAENPVSQKKTWVYQMDWISPAAGGRYKAPHTMDLPFGFDNVEVAPGMVGDIPEDKARAQRLADAVSESYIAFARTGNPNNKHVPKWPQFDLKSRPTMIFDDQVRVMDDPRGNELRFIEKVPYAPNPS